MARTIDKLAVTLGKILKARGLEARLHEYRIAIQWEQTVGPGIARHAMPQTLRGSKLVLTVDSPAWMQQLSLLKPEIIKKLNVTLGREAIRDITLKLGELTPSDRNAPRFKPGSETLTDDERARIERSVELIGDKDLRESVKRVLEKDVLSKKAK